MSTEGLPNNPPHHSTLLSVEHLSVTFLSDKGPVEAVRDISFEMSPGELVAVVGESGSGKSVTGSSIIGLLPDTASVEGKVDFKGRNVLTLPESERRQLRGNEIAIVFQDPMSAFNPLKTVGHQISEGLRIHTELNKARRKKRTLELLDQVEMPNPSTQYDQYPHELSGGMSQRAMIAMALACDPSLLIGDEPTTALDATTQRQVLRLLKRIAVERSMATLLITHDLGSVADFADRVLILYAGKLMESAPAGNFFDRPLNPYGRALLAATPRVGLPLRPIEGRIPDLTSLPGGCVFHPRCDQMLGRDRCRREEPELEGISGADASRASACHYSNELAGEGKEGEASPSISTKDSGSQEGFRGTSQREAPVLEVRALSKTFVTEKRLIAPDLLLPAVDDVTFDLYPGETLALVGESGSGKSTVARLLLRLLDPTAGQVVFEGTDFLSLRGQALREARKRIGLVFQNPDNSLDPRLKAGDVVAEPFKIHADLSSEQIRERVASLLERVGIDPSRADRPTRTFSGGERQRLAIARAIALSPSLVICDEPTTMLDVSVQAQILKLLAEIQATSSSASLVIAHDLSVVRYIADRIAVMYAGRIVEMGRCDEIFSDARHPYTNLLLSAAPTYDEIRSASGSSSIELDEVVTRRPDYDAACHFASTCWRAETLCVDRLPLLEAHQAGSSGVGHRAACHFPIVDEGQMEITNFRGGA